MSVMGMSCRCEVEHIRLLVYELVECSNSWQGGARRWKHCLVHCDYERTGVVSIIARSLGIDTHIGIAFITNIIDILIPVFAPVLRTDKCNSILRVNLKVAYAKTS